MKTLGKTQLFNSSEGVDMRQPRRLIYSMISILLLTSMTSQAVIPKKRGRVPPRVYEADNFMLSAQQLRSDIQRSQTGKLLPVLNEGLHKLQKKIPGESQTKEMVAMNLISLMELYSTVDHRYRSDILKAYYSENQEPQAYKREIVILRDAKHQIIAMAKHTVRHLANNEVGDFFHDQERVLDERLKIFSEIFDACANKVLREISVRVNDEIKSGRADEASSFAQHIRRYDQIRPKGSSTSKIFSELQLDSEKSFLDRVGAYMVKLLGARRGNPSVFHRQIMLAAMSIGILGYSNIMLPTTFKTEALIALVSGVTAYFSNQYRFGPARVFSQRFKEFQKGTALDRSARDCLVILQRRRR